MTDIKVLAQEYIEGLKGEAKSSTMASHLFDGLVKGLARKNHEAWMKAKMADGYTYAEVVDDQKKTSNLLVEYDFLPEAVKADNIRNAKETLKNVVKAGFEIRQLATPAQLEELILSMAESIHDEWARAKAMKGYTFAEQRNDNPEAGPLTHRDMLPFDMLLKMYPADAAYDIDTARGVVEGLQAAGFGICLSESMLATC